MQQQAARSVVFDFGGVLLRWNPQEVVDRCFDEGARSEVMRAVFRHPDWLEMDRGALLDEEAVDRFAARLGRPAGELAHLLKQIRESLVPIGASIAILHDLTRRGIPLYGLSNMPSGTFRYLRGRYDFWSLFRGIVISADIKMIKPDPEIFAHLVAQYGLAYSETVFVDDHLPNIESAGRLGLQTVLFDNPVQCAADLYKLLGLPALND